MHFKMSSEICYTPANEVGGGGILESACQAVGWSVCLQNFVWTAPTVSVQFA